MPNDFSFKGPFEPAFPAQSRNGHEDFNPPVWGISKREYFAAAALKGILSNHQIAIENIDASILVEEAVILADALIKKLG